MPGSRICPKVLNFFRQSRNAQKPAMGNLGFCGDQSGATPTRRRLWGSNPLRILPQPRNCHAVTRVAMTAALQWRCTAGALNGSKWRSMTPICNASWNLGPASQRAFGRQFRRSQDCNSADQNKTKRVCISKPSSLALAKCAPRTRPHLHLGETVSGFVEKWFAVDFAAPVHRIVIPRFAVWLRDRVKGQPARRAWPRHLPSDLLQCSGRFASRAEG